MILDGRLQSLTQQQAWNRLQLLVREFHSLIAKKTRFSEVFTVVRETET